MKNAVEIRLFDGEEQVLCMVGSSIGGGRIMINDLNGCRIDLSAELPAIVISHMDRKRHDSSDYQRSFGRRHECRNSEADEKYERRACTEHYRGG